MSMNKDKIKGVATDIAGKVQEQAGKLIGSKEQQIKGLSKQITGMLYKDTANTEKSVKDLNKP